MVDRAHKAIEEVVSNSYAFKALDALQTFNAFDGIHALDAIYALNAFDALGAFDTFYLTLLTQLDQLALK